jgi:mRNA interferase RelE/StbE
MKTIVFTHAAARDFDSLPLEGRVAVGAGLDRYAMTGSGDVKRLKGREGLRLRTGPWRVLFHEDAMTILAIYIGRRETTTYRKH